MMEDMYYIQTTNDEGLVQYYAVDKTTGHPYMTTYFSSAEAFISLGTAQEVANKHFNGKTVKMSDGSEYPNWITHQALDLSGRKKEGSGHVRIIKMIPRIVVGPASFSGKIVDKPTLTKEQVLAKLTAEEKKALGF